MRIYTVTNDSENELVNAIFEGERNCETVESCDVSGLTKIAEIRSNIDDSETECVYARESGILVLWENCEDASGTLCEISADEFVAAMDKIFA